MRVCGYLSFRLRLYDVETANGLGDKISWLYVCVSHIATILVILPFFLCLMGTKISLYHKQGNYDL